MGPVPGIIGATVDPVGCVQIRGKKRDWVIGQAALLWSKFCRQHACHRINAVMRREDEGGPTLSGPVRKGMQFTCELAFDGQTTVLITGPAMRRVSYPVPMQR